MKTVNDARPATTSEGTVPRLSVIVCTYNRRGLLADCLQSLDVQTLARELFEVVVVDNNSSDGTAELVREWQHINPCVHYVFEPMQGVAHARNRGWRQARGQYVAYIDDDTMAVPEWCARILSAFSTVQPEPVAVGGVILPRLDNKPPWWFSPRLEVRTWGEKAGFLSSPTAHYGFSGANMAFQRHVLCEHGGFNPAFGMFGDKVWLGEEPELFMRIHYTRPYFWFDPAIEVRHYVPQGQLRLRGRLFRAFQTGRARSKFAPAPFTLQAVFVEFGGVLHLFRTRCAERPFAVTYLVISVLERIADRLGYFSQFSVQGS